MLTDLVETNAHGWLWPKGDTQTWPTVIGELPEIPVLADLCGQKRVCIQAGGNGGLWVKDLAGLFVRVHSFEPCAINFRCLVHNVPYSNVNFYNAALGEAAGPVTIDRWCGPQNPGANRVKSGGGDARIIVIDDLKLDEVDLIQLDIEGFELFALRGMVHTIERCKPVISVELRNHSGHFGYSDADVRNWLCGKGYKLAQRINFDEFYVPIG